MNHIALVNSYLWGMLYFKPEQHTTADDNYIMQEM